MQDVYEQLVGRNGLSKSPLAQGLPSNQMTNYNDTPVYSDIYAGDETESGASDSIEGFEDKNFFEAAGELLQISLILILI